MFPPSMSQESTGLNGVKNHSKEIQQVALTGLDNKDTTSNTLDYEV